MKIDHITLLVSSLADSMPYYEKLLPLLGFAAYNEETVQSVRQAMSDSGFPTPEIQNIGPMTALFMKDPDGIRFEVARTPPSFDPADQARRQVSIYLGAEPASDPHGPTSAIRL